MSPIGIFNHVNIIVHEFKLDQQGLNEFVQPGHKGLILTHTSNFRSLNSY